MEILPRNRRDHSFSEGGHITVAFNCPNSSSTPCFLIILGVVVDLTEVLLGIDIPLLGKRQPFTQSSCEVPTLGSFQPFLEISTRCSRNEQEREDREDDDRKQKSRMDMLCPHEN